MDANRLPSLMAAPMASLFLVLCLCAFLMQRPVSTGMHLPLLQVRQIPIRDCDFWHFVSDRDIILRIQGDGSTWINETREPPDQLADTLAMIFANRSYKYLYMFVDPDVSFAEFADVYGKTAASSQGLHIGLISRRMMSQLDHCPDAKGCTVNWPGESANTECKNVIRPLKIPLRIPAK